MFQTFPNHQPAIYFDTIRGASGLSKVGDLPATKNRWARRPPVHSTATSREGTGSAQGTQGCGTKNVGLNIKHASRMEHIHRHIYIYIVTEFIVIVLLLLSFFLLSLLVHMVLYGLYGFIWFHSIIILYYNYGIYLTVRQFTMKMRVNPNWKPWPSCTSMIYRLNKWWLSIAMLCYQRVVRKL